MRYAARAPRPLCVGIVRLRRFPFSSSPLRSPHLLIPLRVRISTRGEEEKGTPRRASFVFFLALDGQQPCRLAALAPMAPRGRRVRRGLGNPRSKLALLVAVARFQGQGILYRSIQRPSALCAASEQATAQGQRLPVPRRARALAEVGRWMPTPTTASTRPSDPLGTASEVNRGNLLTAYESHYGQQPCKHLDQRRRRPHRFSRIFS